MIKHKPLRFFDKEMVECAELGERACRGCMFDTSMDNPRCLNNRKPAILCHHIYRPITDFTTTELAKMIIGVKDEE